MAPDESIERATQRVALASRALDAADRKAAIQAKPGEGVSVAIR
jgi:hypothetical protein